MGNACDRFFTECRAAGCRYLLRFKEGSIPSVYGEYQELRKLEGNYREEIYLVEEKKKGNGNGKKKREGRKVWHDYVTGIAYGRHHVNFIENGESGVMVIRAAVTTGRGNIRQAG